MRKALPLILLAAFTFASGTARAAPPGIKAAGKAKIAAEMTNKGPSGLLGRDCKMLNGIPAWGGLRANNPKAPSELAASGLKATCSGGKVAEVEIRQGFAGKLPKGTAWGMRWKDVKKTLKKAGLKDRTIADKKASGGPMVKLRAKGSGASVTWMWADPKGKMSCDHIVFVK